MVKNRLVFILILILITFTLNTPFSYSKEKIIGNGIWIHIDTFVERTNAEVEELSRFLILKDIRNVFILAKSAEGTLLYKKYEGTLRRIIRIFKDYGIKIHFYIPITIDPYFLKKNANDASFHSPDGSHYYPYRDPKLRYVNLTSERYLSYIKTIIRELILNFDADGIQLDYIRYPNIYYGYSEEEKERFINKGGNWNRILSIMREGTNIFSLYDKKDIDVLLWAETRSEIVTDFAGKIRSFISGISSQVMFSVVLIQSGSSFSSYAEEGHDSYPWGILHFSQNYEALSRLSDFVSPLAYHKNYGKDVSWIRKIIRNTKKRVVSKILCGIGVNDTGSNIEKAIEICKEEGVNFSLFRLGTFIPVINEVKPSGKLTYRMDLKFLTKFYEKWHSEKYVLKIEPINFKKTVHDEVTFFSPISKVKVYFDEKTPILPSSSTLRLLSFMRIKIGSKRYIFDGEEKFFDTSPFIIKGRTMVPVRFISEDFGCTVSWNNGEVTIEKGERLIKLWVGKKEIEINKEVFSIDSSPILKDDRVFVPIRFILEALNLFVYWNGEKEEVEIEGNVKKEENIVLAQSGNEEGEILRNLSFYSSSSVLLENPDDLIELSNLLNDLKRRGIKIFVSIKERDTKNWMKLLKTYSLKIDYLYVADKSYILDREGERMDLFVVEDDSPREALLSYAEFNYKTKDKYFIKIKDPLMMPFLKEFTDLDRNFQGFIIYND